MAAHQGDAPLGSLEPPGPDSLHGTKQGGVTPRASDPRETPHHRPGTRWRQLSDGNTPSISGLK